MLDRSNRPLRLVCALALVVALDGCSAWTRLTQIGESPPLTAIQNPKTQPGYQPVSMPMPNSILTERRPNSLWKAGSRAFFKDQRAANVGDILTIDISFDDKAQFNNETQTQRTTAEQDGITNLFGLEQQIPNSCRTRRTRRASSTSTVRPTTTAKALSRARSK